PLTANWFLNNLGQNGLACWANGPLFAINAPITGNTPMVLVDTAPSLNAGMIVAMPQAQVITVGAEVPGVQDPMLIRWSDAGTYDVWTASITNQAGSLRLSKGS